MSNRTFTLPALLFILLAIAVSNGQQNGAYASHAPPDSARASGAISVTDSLRAFESLARELSSLVTLPEELKSRTVGIEVRSLATGKVIYSLNATSPLTPASTTKVVTAFTALSELGPAYTVKTILASDYRPAPGGVLKGNLYVKGFGDPYFSINEVDMLVDGLLKAGIKQIDGNVVGDGTFFDRKTVRTEYSGDDDEVMALPPIAALTIEHGVYTVVVSSPRTPGLPCTVQTYPASASFEIVNTSLSTGGRATTRKPTTKKGRKTSALLPDDEPRYGDERSPWELVSIQQKTVGGVAAPESAAPKVGGAAAPAAAKPVSTGPLKVSLSDGAGGGQVITVSGSMAANRTVSYRYKMKDPAHVIAGMFYSRLKSHGIVLNGTVTAGATPARRVILAEHGRPLVDILQRVMKNSDNFLAEYVFKMIGAAAGGQEETAEKSVERIQHRMTLNKIPFDRCIINDGSGLSRANCLSASALNGMLTAAHGDRRIFEHFYSAMSIAGVDGTLRKRMRGTHAEGNVHGKTGTLRNTAALTGYVTTRDGEMFSFAMLMNGGNLGAYRGVQDKIASRLAAFSYRDQLVRLSKPTPPPAAAKPPATSKAAVPPKVKAKR